MIKEIVPNVYGLFYANKEEKTFEGVLPLEKGMNYNAYLIKANGKFILFDTVDSEVSEQFNCELKSLLNGQPIAYFFIQHLESDHSAYAYQIIKDNPGVEVITSPLGLNILKRFFDLDGLSYKTHLIKDNEHIIIEDREVVTLTAMMVHWPEVFVAYDVHDQILFSADAFGSFNHLKQDVFTSAFDYEKVWLEHARRYYTNIVGKYGPQVLALLNKAKEVKIKYLCPLHGPVFDNLKDIDFIIRKYLLWASYQEEKNGVLVLSSSIYGHTYEVAQKIYQTLLANHLDATFIDLNNEDVSYALSASFIYRKIVLCASTFNMGIFTSMEHYLLDMINHQVKNKKFYLVENGSWAPSSGRLMKEMINKVPNNEVHEEIYTITSAHHPSDDERLKAYIDKIINS